MSSKRIFHQKNRKRNFMKETHKYAKRKKRESSEKRAVLKERHKYATQKKTGKNKKNRQKLRCHRPKYILGGPGRPPQPEFASKIKARRDDFSGNPQPKLRFGVFFVFLFFLFFCPSNFVFFSQNGNVFLCS